MIPFVPKRSERKAEWRSGGSGSNDVIPRKGRLDPRAAGVANGAMMIYKILRLGEWAALQANGSTGGAPVDLADGFVHFSTGPQLAETLSRHFADEHDLMLLACDSARLGAELRWEPSRRDELFPHLYRPLRHEDIAWTRALRRGPDGHETGPLA